MKIEEFLGEKIETGALRSRRARQLAAFLDAGRCPYFRLISRHANATHDFLAIEIDVEVAQDRSVAINPTEPLIVAFSRETDDRHPEVFPRRDDFPLDQLHVMVDANSGLHSLCLYAAQFREIRSRTTPFSFLLRIKTWLEQAADGTLHPEDQPLEPVLIGAAGTIILPRGEFSSGRLDVVSAHKSANDQWTLRAGAIAEVAPMDQPNFVVRKIAANAHVAAASIYTPRTLDDLSTLLSTRGVDLAKQLLGWAISLKNSVNHEIAMPLLLVSFPKRRAEDAEIEGVDVWAFLINATFKELGASLGNYESGKFGAVPLLGESIQRPKLDEVGISPLIVLREIGRGELAAYSGDESGSEQSILAVGVGALGSKVVELALRAGFGQWTILDDDTFRPHNIARHVLGDWSVGRAKVAELQTFLNAAIPGGGISGILENDLLTDFDDAGVQAELEKSEFVVDMSASVPVARKLAGAANVKRTASIFLSPQGSDLVVLRESGDRSISLLELEADYYKALCTNALLAGHLTDSRGAPIRYGAGCRDLSAQIGADIVSTLAGIATRQIKKFKSEPDALASIWRLDEESCAVTRINLSVSLYRMIAATDWTLHWSEALLQDIAQMRQSDLPNETGGVLVGMVDFEAQSIFICLTIEPPPDSTKRPHYFERGRTGLAQRLEEIGDQTGGQLRYVGEWHSHPRHVAARPSADDDQLFDALRSAFLGTGEPYIMGIMGVDEFFFRFGCDERLSEHVLGIMSSDGDEDVRRMA